MAVASTDTRPLARTQRQRSDATTAAVLSATVATVVEAGPATGLADIARRAGVTKGALQHHFPSKVDLLAAVVSLGWSDLVERLEGQSDATPQLADRLRSLIEAMWTSYQQPACRAAFMISSDPNITPELAFRLSSTFDDIRERLDAQWAASFADFDLRPGRVAAARRFARSHLLGMLVQRQLPSTEPDPSDELTMLSQATMHLITSPDAM